MTLLRSKVLLKEHRCTLISHNHRHIKLLTLVSLLNYRLSFSPLSNLMRLLFNVTCRQPFSNGSMKYRDDLLTYYLLKILFHV